MTNEQRLLSLIENDENVKRYQLLEVIVNQDANIKKDLAQLKKLQKELVNAKHLGKTNLTQKLEADYQRLIDAFNEHPLVLEYLELQDYCNQLINNIKNIIETAINEKLESDS